MEMWPWPSSDTSATVQRRRDERSEGAERVKDQEEPGSDSAVDVGLTLHGSSSYSVMEVIGKGSFGRVLKCQNVATQETVAIKIMEDAHWEVSMLEMIRSLDPVRTNIVHFLESFQFMVLTCLTFELLDLSLHDLMERSEWEPLCVQKIRPVAQQMFVALDALKQLGVLHTDIKPDNIMLVNMQKEGMRIKLIDFGLAFAASQADQRQLIQPVGYRAPEVSLGLLYSEAIDIWGLGCVLAFLYLAESLFPLNCCYQMMKCVVELVGQPDHHMLQTGMYTRFYFSEVQAGDCTSWRLMTPEEFVAANHIDLEEHIRFNILPSSVDGLFDIYEETEAAESEDRWAFLDLLKRMLHVDGTQRITPSQALQHPFITMSILAENPDYSPYLTTSQAEMRVCPSTSDSDEPAAKSSVEAPAPAPCDKDSWVSSDEAEDAYQKATNSTGEASSPSVLKRIHQFFRQAVAAFTRCTRPHVED